MYIDSVKIDVNLDAVKTVCTISTMQKKKTYHHGNLRTALMDAAIELLKNGDSSELSLRGVAKLAGVSHAAPAHHFNGKDGLLAAVAARGFVVFADYMTEEIQGLNEADHFNRIKGVCKGYLRFALNEQSLFDLILTVDKRFTWTDEVYAASMRSQQILARACAPFASEKDGAIETLIWSMVHGYTALARSGHLLPEPEADFATLVGMIDMLQLKTMQG